MSSLSNRSCTARNSFDAYVVSACQNRPQGRFCFAQKRNAPPKRGGVSKVRWCYSDIAQSTPCRRRRMPSLHSRQRRLGNRSPRKLLLLAHAGFHNVACRSYPALWLFLSGRVLRGHGSGSCIPKCCSCVDENRCPFYILRHLHHLSRCVTI